MKTLEQVKEHLATTYYDCRDKICGFLVGCELKDPKEVIMFLKEDDYVYSFDDFLEWFESDEEDDEEDCDGCDCPLCKCWGNKLDQLPQALMDDLLKGIGKYEAGKLFQTILNSLTPVSPKEEPKVKPFKYQGEEREKLNKDYIELKQAAEHSAYICKRDPNRINAKIYDALLEKFLIISNKLQERVDE